ncbi:MULTISPECIES: HipA domain-containing protein [unclassified Roseateles]|uniref:HipA domain-containing protein n=1 Tax=unclassified Roseateles TaxID=2626991 RepID=UPI0006F87EF1|nr:MULTISPECIES: HipA domain-containing protein [unclassified Roseateles]KQW42750.1 hypothetical protein ASC81_19005 [Pelomonas sp. Root405]KRA69427.1 hypothetical protein ASD88_19655 [Pelomonas sp. Root662]
MAELTTEHHLVLGALAARGLLSSPQMQAITGKSQPTLSRILADLGSRVVALGQARSARYGLSQSIHGTPSQQPVLLTLQSGETRRIGQLTLLVSDTLHLGGPGVSVATQGELPWLLSPLVAQGFLGRLLAQRLAAPGISTDPAAWTLETQLFAALHLHDGSGALSLGEPQPGTALPALPASPTALAAALDALADDVAGTLPAGSSAGGEQPKLLARQEGGGPLLVKFTPPRGTPFGERWHDLLHAEHLALRTLAAHGVAVAASRIVASPRRTYLLSERFDRLGDHGRRHAVAIAAAHAGFLPGGYWNWPRSAQGLAGQRRLSSLDAARAQALWDFGRLIGNTDMHGGNLALWVDGEDLTGLLKGRFTLAPVYDMLPMRWRPDATLGCAADYSAFEPDALARSGGAREPAQAFWHALAGSADVSTTLREVASEMAGRLASSAR